eukprot:scaffold145057_cov124-Phaeocystis_antarctica.AAC.1
MGQVALPPARERLLGGRLDVAEAAAVGDALHELGVRLDPDEGRNLRDRRGRRRHELFVRQPQDLLRAALPFGMPAAHVVGPSAKLDALAQPQLGKGVEGPARRRG